MTPMAPMAPMACSTSGIVLPSRLAVAPCRRALPSRLAVSSHLVWYMRYLRNPCHYVYCMLQINLQQEHSNCERGYLTVLREHLIVRLANRMSEEAKNEGADACAATCAAACPVVIEVSQNDADPLTVI